MTIKCLKTEAGKLPHKILILFQFTILTLSNANADAFFDHYSSGRFEQAYDSFETSVQDSRPNSNYETYLNVLMDVFAQQDNKSINSLRTKIQALRKKKINFFLKKRIKSDLRQLELYKSLRTSNEGTIENAILEAAATKGSKLKYNHEKMSKLRVIQMIMTNRTYTNRRTHSDYYLSALIDYEMSKGGRDLLAKFFESAKKDNPFYSKALKLNEKFN